MVMASLIFQTTFTQAEQLSPKQVEVLGNHKWFAGASWCWFSNEQPIETYQLTPSTYIFRQNKCDHYEAPFIYLMMGKEKLFIQDTGATEDFPLYETVSKIALEYYGKEKASGIHWLVTHSHGHSDHKAGDNQFRGRPNVTLVEASLESVKNFYGFKDWPNGEVVLDLGERKLTVFPIPGHQSESIAVYDSETAILLTGDTVYPGRLYVKNWAQFKTSIDKLTQFSNSKNPTAVLGTHIEMSQTPGIDYKLGSTNQPNEASLVLSTSDLEILNAELETLGNKPVRKVLDKFIVFPVN